MIFFRFALLLVAVVFVVSACKMAGETTKPVSEKTTTGSEESKNKTDETKGEKTKSKEITWTHKKGEGGPENWAKLEMEGNACGGKAQSPIDIVTKDAKKGEDLAAFKFAYGESDANIVNNGHTVQFNTTGDHKVTIGDKEYKLLQFHYHAASEHTIDGKQFPLEVHFVHKNTDTDFAVLGVMFEEGAENEFLKTYLKDFPAEKGEKKAEGKIDLAKLFPENKSYFNYKGSLTTPPCSEVVNWHVLKAPVTASKEQLESFAKILDGNFRPVMPLEGREVSSFGE